MNRKIKLSLITLLGIGSISIASLPLVSCGNSETTGQDLKEITGITLVANPAGLTYEELQVTPITLLTTQKVFDGIDSTNYKQFDISMSGSTGQVTMDLTPKEGFIFPNNQNILKSNEFVYPEPIVEEVRFSTSNRINIVGYSDRTATIVKSDGYTGSLDLVIEDSYVATNSKAYTITSIGILAFQKSKLTSLIIPNSVTTIGDAAFMLSELTSLDLSQNTSLTSIGYDAFRSSTLTTLDLSKNTLLRSISGFNSSELTTLDLSKNTSLTSIGDFAFQNSRLTTLDLTQNTSLTTIGDHAFAYSKLTTLDLSKNTLLRSISGFNLSELTSLDLSQNTSLTNIGIAAFQNSKLTTLDLSKNTLLTSIGILAFHNSPLTSLDLSQNTSLKYIGYSAFFSSTLTTLIIPDSVTTIENNAFNATKNIEGANLQLPSQFMESSELTRIGITIKPPIFMSIIKNTTFK